jgi:signal transduction histidine kinase
MLQVLLNLLSNATKFSPEGGEIVVCADMLSAGQLALAIEDQGPGVAPEHIERLGESFHQIRPDLGQSHEGTGLGLALSMRLMELNGGTMAFASEPGHGLRVTLTFAAERTRSIARAA